MVNMHVALRLHCLLRGKTAESVSACFEMGLIRGLKVKVSV
jgi:hypothetical protein